MGSLLPNILGALCCVGGSHFVSSGQVMDCWRSLLYWWACAGRCGQIDRRHILQIVFAKLNLCAVANNLKTWGIYYEHVHALFACCRSDWSCLNSFPFVLWISSTLAGRLLEVWCSLHWSEKHWEVLKQWHSLLCMLVWSEIGFFADLLVLRSYTKGKWGDFMHNEKDCPSQLIEFKVFVIHKWQWGRRWNQIW